MGETSQRAGHLYRIFLGHVLTVDGDTHFHTAIAGGVVVKQDLYPRHRPDADAQGKEIVDAVAFMLSDRHRRPLALIDGVVFHRGAKMLLVMRLIIALHLGPGIPFLPLPTAPELTGTFRQCILGIGGSGTERISQRALFNAAGGITYRMVDIQAPAGDHRQQLAVIPQCRAVIALGPNHRQPFRVQRRFPFQIAAKLGRQHRWLPQRQCRAVFLLRRSGQVTQPASAHLKTFAIFF